MPEPFENVVETELRTKEQVNQEYSNCALQLGDATFKNELAYRDIDVNKKKMEELRVRMHAIMKEKTV